MNPTNMANADNSNKTKWGIDLAHSEFGFKVKHLMIASIRGNFKEVEASIYTTVSYTHLRAHETVLDIVCRLLLEKKKKKHKTNTS